MIDKGFVIIEKNYRCRLGEIDLIGKIDGYLVFIEVKYRKDRRKGTPIEAVNYYKQKTICKVADYYRITHKMTEEDGCRFDVIAIEGEEITHIIDAFSYI